MRLVFLGSGAFAIPPFEALHQAGHDIPLVVTQPDRPKGRGKGLAPPPLKPVALQRGRALLQPRRIRDPEALAPLREARPELLVVVAYGQILPRSVLDLAPRGAVNVHASLLPKYRGAAPIQWAIARGESETGVTTMLLDEGLDTGPTLLSRSAPIGPEETSPSLEARLAEIGAALLLETVSGLQAGTLSPRPQDAAAASLAPILRKEDGRIDWSLAAVDIARRVRAFDPWPGTWTTLDGRSLKVLAAAPAAGKSDEPGRVVGVEREGILVGCGTATLLRVRQVQPESRRPMDATAFAAGARLKPGARFL